MEFLENIWAKARKLEKIIILPEAEDIRTLKAAELITKSKLAKVILVGNTVEIHRNTVENSIDISNAEIADPGTHPKIDRYTEIYVKNMEKRGHPIPFEEAKQYLKKDFPFFGAMMLAEGDADGMVSGANHATAHTIKAAVYSVGLKPGISVLSSFFAMVLKERIFGSGGVLFYADCGVVPEPDEKQLADIAICTASSFRKLMGKEPRIAMLSFSTKGSGRAKSVDKVVAATKLALEKEPGLQIDGELQADAALILSIGKKKAPESKIAGRANVLIFPDLNSGNIAYKLTERLAGAMALGPIFQGCAKVINDLSRGCSVDDIVNVAAITALQT
ncbi:MAG: phosphate acetyltransferase, partial [Candidatus Margulisiibacteriota bacterium]